MTHVWISLALIVSMLSTLFIGYLLGANKQLTFGLAEIDYLRSELDRLRKYIAERDKKEMDNA